MADIRYSICATHYNNMEYIEESVGVLSDLIQNKEKWEIVITDAGSSDGSLRYLRDLSRDRGDVRVIVRDGISIGEGRKLATEKARGTILVHPMDLDAIYYNDERLFKTTRRYEQLIEQEGDIYLGAGVEFITKSLLRALGGWSELTSCEETELKRRALRENKLRFCTLKMFHSHGGDCKNLSEKVGRFYNNSVAKFRSGVGFWYMIYYWLRYSNNIKSKVGATIIFPAAYLGYLRAGKNRKSYDKRDNYILDFKRSVYQQHPEIWIDPGEELRDYVDEEEKLHLKK